jgi:hypothetical protein
MPHFSPFAQCASTIPFSNCSYTGTTEGVGHESGHLSYQTGMHTEDQQTYRKKKRRSRDKCFAYVGTIHKTITSGLDLGKKLSDSISVIDDLKLKITGCKQRTCRNVFMPKCLYYQSRRQFYTLAQAASTQLKC